MKISGPYSSRPSTPWRLYHRGKQYWFKTKDAAEKKAAKLGDGKTRTYTHREMDEYQHCRELLQGVPILRAVRYYLEHHAAQHVNSVRTTHDLIDAFKKTITGRPKYVTEAKRNLTLLDEHLGNTMMVGAVTPVTLGTFFDSFESAWSHDAALKFARSFFKYCASPKVRARTDNPTDIFEFKNPSGTRVHLSLEDTLHVVETAQKEFRPALPAIGLQLFAGIRTEEIIRLSWKAIKRGKSIRLDADVAKMGQVGTQDAPRVVDWWPRALDATIPEKIPTDGLVCPGYRDIKHDLLQRCRETKKDFKWGQNAFRHSYATYGWAFWQSADKVAKLLGERDVDTVFNHYANYEEEDAGQKYFSTGSAVAEELPVPKSAFKFLQNLVNSSALADTLKKAQTSA